jgi:2-polyprenyl-3-methyl-5-hydroxy-6-metoxy-1,4-benzoquinol methylase
MVGFTFASAANGRLVGQREPRSEGADESATFQKCSFKVLSRQRTKAHNVRRVHGESMVTQADDVRLEAHFEFGENWDRLVQRITPAHLDASIREIRSFMGVESLTGKSFLDVGCGSGLSSLAAYRLGASEITSVDIDPKNIQNLGDLRTKFAVPDSARWRAYRASIVDDGDVAKLPSADIVYSWGVLHHTGAMWRGVENCINLVNPGGWLYLMLYRDAWLAGAWQRVKRAYTRGGPVTKFAIRNAFAGALVAGILAKGKNPARVMRDYPHAEGGRGMTWYVSIVDWVGGYPFEYTSPEDAISFVTSRGFTLERISPAQHGKKPLGHRGTGSFSYLFRR